MQGYISTKNLLGVTKSSLLVQVRDKMFLQFNPQWFEPDFYVICVDPRAVQFAAVFYPLIAGFGISRPMSGPQERRRRRV